MGGEDSSPFDCAFGAFALALSKAEKSRLTYFWVQRFANLVRQAFIHVDFASHHVHAGYFDILSPKGHVILPAVWSEVIEPGWELSMHMWPMPEPVVPVSPHPPPPPPPFSPPPHPRRSRRGVHDERYVRVFEDDASSCVSENDTCIPERDYVPSGPLSEISEEGRFCASMF